MFRSILSTYLFSIPHAGDGAGIGEMIAIGGVKKNHYLNQRLRPMQAGTRRWYRSSAK
jgi:hypothetical protein